ncbi:MAG: MJ1477/TM1410 family putative glycoside hydrolase [Devosia sp.]|uniref:MJ1477/TM1410 family putative glycoside hydrolase n=1 Tax=Devosia sp. TaxID=1871048 RepID=UPI0033911E04
MTVNAAQVALSYLSDRRRNDLRKGSADKMGISEILSSRSGRMHAVPVLGASVMMHLALAVAASPALGISARPNLAEARSWGYQLQMVDPDLVADSPYDLMVIDYARDGSAEQAFSRSDVMAMKRRPDGGSRIVLAYLSIGEAEDYRFYWNRNWQASAPSWLGKENPDWPGNYAVRYWDTAWQDVILGGPEAYLDRIIAAGFDGVYLDRIDAFDIADPTLSRARRMQVMVEFVSTIAAYARSAQPGFIVVGQNAEELLNYPDYAAAIDGVGKEDLFFGLDGDGTLNSKGELRASLTPLQRFLASGKPVFLIEYLDTAEAMALAHKNAEALGVPLFIGSRELDDVRSR